MVKILVPSKNILTVNLPSKIASWLLSHANSKLQTFTVAGKYFYHQNLAFAIKIFLIIILLSLVVLMTICIVISLYEKANAVICFCSNCKGKQPRDCTSITSVLQLLIIFTTHFACTGNNSKLLYG